MSKIGKVLLSPLAAVTGVFKKPKISPPPIVPPPATPRANSALRDVFAARRGVRENLRSGAGGAEAGVGLKSKLGR
jgi:hypothetical protein